MSQCLRIPFDNRGYIFSSILAMKKAGQSILLTKYIFRENEKKR
jgi:hypothetical protein